MKVAQQPDALKKLLVFIIALAILGTVIALTWHFAADLPQQQKALQAPMNGPAQIMEKQYRRIIESER